jgi:DNA-binding transcriptional MerR regulator
MSHVVFSQHRLVLVRSAETSQTLYSLEAASRLTGVHPDLLQHYCRIGLLGETHTQPDVEPVFDDNALYEVRRIEHFRRHHVVNLRALPLVCRLSREIEQLHTELRFLRDR